MPRLIQFNQSMKSYKYIGSVEVLVYGLGVIKPGDIVNTDLSIDNPDFQLTEDVNSAITNGKSKK